MQNPHTPLARPTPPLAAGATTSPRSLSLSAAFVSAQDAATAAGDAPVQLENVTLVLPPAEYMALLTLATDKTAWSVRHCMDAPTLQLAAALNGSAAVLDASAGLGSNGGGSGGSDAAALAALWQSLLLSRFTGWGVNGTQLRLVPAAALPTAVTAACVPGGAEEGGGGGSGGLSGGAIAGIVVGSVVGAALLVGGGVWAVRERRRRRDRCDVLRRPPCAPCAGRLRPSKANCALTDCCCT